MAWSASVLLISFAAAVTLADRRVMTFFTILATTTVPFAYFLTSLNAWELIGIIACNILTIVFNFVPIIITWWIRRNKEIIESHFNLDFPL